VGAATLALLALLALIALATPLNAQTPEPPAPYDGVVTIEVWSDLDRIIHGESPIEERLLREVQYTLSGMIYGWEYVYTPQFPARGVERRFELTPIAGIPWGDPRLTLRNLRDDRTVLYGQVDFALSESDRARISAWRSMSTERSAGIGSAPLLQGYPSKITAIEEAIHQAIRDYLRSITFNPPREVRGRVVLERQPRIRTVSGTWEAQVRVLLVVDERIEYVAF
jgi:hypothetical protein